MKILVGVDDSKYSGDILRAIVSERRADNTEVLVLHVLQLGREAPPQMHQVYAPELEAEREAAKTLVERIATELRSAGFKAETLVGVGDVREGIIDTAADWHADLIMAAWAVVRGM